MRTYFGGKLIADSEHVLLVYETKRPPAYWFPIADVRMEYLEASHQATDTIRWHLAVKDRITQNAARAYLKPTDDRAALEGHLTFFWDRMDAWFEEDEQVFVHPRDPYSRVDTVHSSRHVRVKIDGVTLGETRRPTLLFETGLPTRYYIPKLDVRIDLLEPSEYVTSCPYKGVARHWSARVGDKVVKDIVWSYPAPIPECPKIENLLSFYNEHVDLYVDGALQIFTNHAVLLNVHRLADRQEKTRYILRCQVARPLAGAGGGAPGFNASVKMGAAPQRRILPRALKGPTLPPSPAGRSRAGDPWTRGSSPRVSASVMLSCQGGESPTDVKS